MQFFLWCSFWRGSFPELPETRSSPAQRRRLDSTVCDSAPESRNKCWVVENLLDVWTKKAGLNGVWSAPESRNKWWVVKIYWMCEHTIICIIKFDVYSANKQPVTTTKNAQVTTTMSSTEILYIILGHFSSGSVRWDTVCLFFLSFVFQCSTSYCYRGFVLF